VAEDYSGPFDPDWRLERLSRAALARLCREYMLVSMFHDRGLMPHVATAGGAQATIRHADAEWMGASPIYTRRNKANLGIEGDDVAAVFKSFQFDIGAPHHFLDFRFEVVDTQLGYFWLPFCGAHDYLRQLTRNDTGLVTDMCHHMEDRTFDATLAVTNPSARAIPVHRPPKPDEFSGEHCRWEVRVSGADTPARPGEASEQVVGASAAARFEFDLGEPVEPGGLDDYRGAFRPDLRLEDLAHHVLVRQAKEFALDIHLLMRAGYFAVDEFLGTEVLDAAAPQHLAAVSPPIVSRLREALRIEGDDMGAIAKLLQVTPLLVDDYLRCRVEVDDAAHGRLWFEPSAGLDDEVCRSPLSWLAEPETPGFEHVVQAVNPRAGVRPIEPTEAHPDAVLAWDLVIDPDAEPVAPHWAAEMTGGGGIVGFDLTERQVPVEIRRR